MLTGHHEGLPVWDVAWSGDSMFLVSCGADRSLVVRVVPRSVRAICVDLRSPWLAFSLGSDDLISPLLVRLVFMFFKELSVFLSALPSCKLRRPRAWYKGRRHLLCLLREKRFRSVHRRNVLNIEECHLTSPARAVSKKIRSVDTHIFHNVRSDLSKIKVAKRWGGLPRSTQLHFVMSNSIYT